MNDQSLSLSRRQVQVLPPLEDLDRMLHLDPETGVLRWRIKSNNRYPAGSVAGYAQKNQGYIKVGIFGRFYFAHRVVWKMFHREEPPPYVDHKDRNPANNRPDNLREATQAQNCGNSRLRKNNTSGAKGVFFRKNTGKWSACLTPHGRYMWLGTFDTMEEARDAVMAARREHLGEFAHDG